MLQDSNIRDYKLAEDNADIPDPLLFLARPDSILLTKEMAAREGIAIGVFVGMYLIYNAVSISVVQRKKEIGILRALGTVGRTVSELYLRTSVTEMSISWPTRHFPGNADRHHRDPADKRAGFPSSGPSCFQRCLRLWLACTRPGTNIVEAQAYE